VPGGGSIDREPAPRFDEAGDATRRTRLANERTYLAWWRTGLASLAVAFGAGKIVPGLTNGANWPFIALGALYALFGVGCFAYGFWRDRVVDAAISRGEYARPNRWAVLALAVFGVLIALLSFVAIVVT
jgi:putative membrane protein